MTSAASKFWRLREPITIAAPRRAVIAVANAPARKCVTRRECSAVIRASSAFRCGRKIREFSFHRPAETAASRTNPGQITPKRSRKKPSNKGGKNPPSPPIAPTRLVTTLVLFGKYCGTSLNTLPFPRPSSTAEPNAPTLNGRIEPDDISSANGTMPANTPPQHTRAADAVGKPSSNRAHAGCHDHKAGRTESRISEAQLELVSQQQRKVYRQCDESAERQEVKTRQRPRQPLGLQQPKHFSNSGGYFPRWRISREQSKHGRPNQCKRRSTVEDVLPTDGLSCQWSEKHRC